MRRVLAAAMAALTLAAGSTSALAVEFGFRGAYWFPKLSGTVESTTAGFPNTPIDLKNTLGIEDKNFPFGEAFLRTGRVTLRVGYSQIKYDASTQLTQTIVFDGQTYEASDNVASMLDMKMFAGEVQYDILRPDAGVAAFNLGLLLRVMYVDGKVQLTSATVGTTVQDFNAPIPMPGVAVGVGFLKDLIRVDARGAGIAYSGNHFVDADAYASVTPLPFVRLQGGYRYMELKAGGDVDLKGTITLKGPYLGAQVSF
jgi:outer membrane protein